MELSRRKRVLSIEWIYGCSIKDEPIKLKGSGNDVTEKIMAGVFEQVADILKRTWECKQCHQHITEDHTVAYHLIDGILYGWCESCFSQRPALNGATASRAA